MPLGEWVLEAACRQNRRWIDSGLAPLPIAVNLSARQFEHQQLEVLVARVLREADLPPELLELELTESVFLHDVRATRVILENLQAMGVRCSLDDFGTGFSGLNYLAEMPIDSLKIDQSFVQKIGTGQDDAIVGAVIALAHSLGMKVVAEGVETGEQARFLRSHGCEQMQGYLFSGPLPPDELEDMIRARVGVGVGVGAYPLPGAAAALHSQAGTQPRPDLPGLAGVESLLSMMCRDGANHHFDPDLVAAVLTALESDERLAPLAQRLSRSASVRLAAGTFAGLMPLGGGLAAAGALPAPAQLFAAGAFAHIGIAVPTPDRWVISNGRTHLQPKRAPARHMPLPDPGPEPSRTPNPPTGSNPGSGGSDPGTPTEKPGNPDPGTPVVDHGQPNPGSPVETPGNPNPGTPVETPGNPNPGTPVEKPGNPDPGRPVGTPGNPTLPGPDSSTTTGKHGL
jgi:EAL domain-containing protein (putative c-di-GMP-specific phosphodiesterase class I)